MIFFLRRALYVALAVLKLIEIHTPLIPECWDGRC